MSSLLKDAAAHYDLVLLDTSPISAYADAITLSQHTNGILLVVHPNVTPKTSLLRSAAELRESGAQILGIVINETPESKDSYLSSIESHQPPFNPLRSSRPHEEPSVGVSKSDLNPGGLG